MNVWGLVRRRLRTMLWLSRRNVPKESLNCLTKWVCLRLSLLSNSIWLSRITLSYLSCNSLLARITKQFNSPDVWFLVATSLATEKISVATQLATQLHES
jgi:hypothetical protein